LWERKSEKVFESLSIVKILHWYNAKIYKLSLISVKNNKTFQFLNIVYTYFIFAISDFLQCSLPLAATWNRIQLQLWLYNQDLAFVFALFIHREEDHRIPSRIGGNLR